MMIASSPFAPAPATAPATLGLGGADPTVGSFTQSLQAVATINDNGLAPPTLPAQTAAVAVALPAAPPPIPAAALTTAPQSVPSVPAVAKSDTTPLAAPQAIPADTPQPVIVQAQATAEPVMTATAPAPAAVDQAGSTGLAAETPRPPQARTNAPIDADAAATADPVPETKPAAPRIEIESVTRPVRPAEATATPVEDQPIAPEPAPVATPAAPAPAATASKPSVEKVVAETAATGATPIAREIRAEAPAPKRAGKTTLQPAGEAARANDVATPAQANEPIPTAALAAATPQPGLRTPERAMDAEPAPVESSNPAAAAVPPPLETVQRPIIAAATVEPKASTQVAGASPISTPADAAPVAPRAAADAPPLRAEHAEAQPFLVPEAPAAPADADGLPTQLLGQTLAPASRPLSAETVYAAQQTHAQPGTVTAQPGRFGLDMGVEIARRISAGQEEMLVRLNPQDMGRIDVRVSFDESGTVRAVLASESPAALELLRRESGDLARSLSDAGVRSDGQSFRFDRGGTESGWQRGQNGGSSTGQQGGSQHGRQDGRFAGADTDQDMPAYRQLRSSGQVDLIA